MEQISVIVPVYKAEAYLDKCIASIAEQTYENLEIILVEDGSPDRCGEICGRWAAKDARIRVLHQKNAGGGAARNAGLDVAGGKLIAFVDSDDYLAPDMYRHLADLLEQGADIAECGYVTAWDDHAVFGGEANLCTYTAEQAMGEHIHDRFFRQLIWNKLYRREMIADIRFPAGKQIDDEFFTYRVLGNAKKLIRSERVCYAYRQQANSVMHSMGAQNRLQAVEAKAQRHNYILDKFPHLAALSRKDLWFTGLYQGQLALREQKPPEVRRTMAYLRDMLKAYPVEPGDCAGKERLWLTLAGISLRGTCKMRNWLKIGL